MSLFNINPTKTASWKELIKHYEETKDVHMKSLFLEDSDRKDKMSLQFEDLNLDFSKNRMTEKTMNLLVELAKECELEDAIEKYFGGDKINETENRAVLHTALRNKDANPILVDGKDVMPEVNETLNKIEAFTEEVVNGSFKGYSGKSFTDVVNIGIGGSDLGPNMVVEGLHFYKNHLNTHFVSNIDGDHVAEVIKDLNPETTLFVIVSKTFTTQETLTNAETIKKWFLQSAKEDDIQYNFVAVSTNLEKVKNFGIDEKNIFTMWNWVGGRYSLWSAVGLSISLAIGFENFRKFLDGAYAMDQHFKKTDFSKNIPVIMALISIWYNNFFGSESEVVIPYTQYLQKLAPFLQQLSMESNGKSVDRNGEEVTYQTGNIIWGNTGTNVQHAFMQLVHQGTKLIPVDFIGFKESLHGNEDHHQKLMANFYAQAEALYAGKTAEEVHLDMKISGDEKKINHLLPFKVFNGNRPSNMFLIEKLDPRSLGSLISSYEHKTFVQGIIWNIYSFDQFGVELGKELANKLLIK
ncbi:glucose-6-phosphate isomerase [Lutimonas zeaxanthinifaciens]|uniref:glucose-6-phosphate isomerase n=1 Tax=Lutimonas zeaxanthinifaciens TaxID=3060215 RepID=UPI00265CAE33|nr:glucose-6-phosphate isomerase [Lutimonas sp. YSD2104]WKK65985.1 glucose-6-phosphate isomerase [Lutimonas sp. YSD2104]